MATGVPIALQQRLDRAKQDAATAAAAAPQEQEASRVVPFVPADASVFEAVLNQITPAPVAAASDTVPDPAPAPDPAPEPALAFPDLPAELPKEALRDVRAVDPHVADQIAGLQGGLAQLKSITAELRSAITERDATISDLRTQLEQRAAVPLTDINMPAELTPEERALFNPSSLAVVERIANRAAATAAQQVQAAAETKIHEITGLVQRTTASMEERDAKTRLSAFQQNVLRDYPSVGTWFKNDPVFARYLEEAVSPLVPGTVGDVLRAAWSAQDETVVKRVLAGYKARSVAAPAASPVTDAARRTPQQPSTSAAPASASAPPDKLARSVLTRATANFVRGKLDGGKMTQLIQRYREAYQLGLVDDNA